MPNWCQNEITIKHKDPAMVDRAQHSDGLLMEFLPTPKPLIDTTAGWFGEGEQQAALAAQQAENIKLYGFKDWYDWNVANWGTKWDVNLDDVERLDENTLTASFESAWSPPIKAYEQLCALGFEIEAYYNEPGMCFCGKWTGYYQGDQETGHVFTDNDYNEYSNETRDSVRQAIGAELDDYWGISESMAQ